MDRALPVEQRPRGGGSAGPSRAKPDVAIVDVTDAGPFVELLHRAAAQRASGDVTAAEHPRRQLGARSGAPLPGRCRRRCITPGHSVDR